MGCKKSVFIALQLIVGCNSYSSRYFMLNSLIPPFKVWRACFCFVSMQL